MVVSRAGVLTTPVPAAVERAALVVAFAEGAEAQAAAAQVATDVSCASALIANVTGGEDAALEPTRTTERPRATARLAGLGVATTDQPGPTAGLTVGAARARGDAEVATDLRIWAAEVGPDTPVGDAGLAR